MGFARTLVVFLLSLLSCATGAAEDARRVIFDQHFNWLTPNAAETTLQRIRAAGFNVFIPCVWLGRGTTWPSELAPPTPEWVAVRDRAPDPLAHLITRAHALGIEVHIWFTVSYRTRDFLNQYYDTGTPANAFNIHDRHFRMFLVALINEVATRYAIDGINLDYVRSLGVCVSESCAADYKTRFKRELDADRAFVDARENAFGKFPPAWEALSAWNRNALTELVRAISDTARRARPKLVISVDTIAEIREFRLQGADAVEWVNRGWVDVIYHMDYGRTLDAGPINAARRRLKDSDRFRILLSTADWKNDRQGSAEAYSRTPQLLSEQVTRIREVWKQRDIALWTYRFLTDAQIEALRAIW